MKYTSFFSLFSVLFIISCGNIDSANDESKTDRSRSEMIIDSAIAHHGGDAYKYSDITFGFRKGLYSVELNDGGYSYTREFADSLGSHFQLLDNAGYTARVNNQPSELSAKDSAAAANSLNSVVYFALLPRFLSDPAVHSKLLGNESLNGKDYYRVKVTFSEEGGGEDHEDVYLYWFDTEDYSLDYLAYSFFEDDGGTRFRVARNSRRVNGILFQDYDNFKGPGPDSLMQISNMYRKGEIDKLSEINLDRLKVTHPQP